MAQRERSAATGAPSAARLRELVEPIVVDAKLDLEELSVARAGRRFLVRITVDGDHGVGHDELSDVSRAISVGLDEAERVGGELTPDGYTLEVSSPGIDRPLTLPRHWRRNIGRLVKVTSREGQGRERMLTGRITAATESEIALDVAGRVSQLPYPELGPGRIQVEFTRLAQLTDDEIGELTDDADDDSTANDDSTGDHTDDHTDGDEELEDET